MTGRQALDRAAQRFAGIDIRLAGDWDSVPAEIVQAADEIAEVCDIYPTAITRADCIGDVAAIIGQRFVDHRYSNFSLIV